MSKGSHNRDINNANDITVNDYNLIILSNALLISTLIWYFDLHIIHVINNSNVSITMIAFINIGSSTYESLVIFNELTSSLLHSIEAFMFNWKFFFIIINLFLYLLYFEDLVSNLWILNQYGMLIHLNTS